MLGDFVFAHTRVPVAFFQVRYSDADKNRLCLNDVTLYILSPGGLTWSVGMMSIFDTACLTELDAKTGYMYHALTNLQMSSDLLN